jgi:hypothetical protein
MVIMIIQFNDKYFEYIICNMLIRVNDTLEIKINYELCYDGPIYLEQNNLLN